MNNVVEFVNSFKPKVSSRADIAGRLELAHKCEEVIIPPNKNYFNILDLCIPVDFFMKIKFGKRESLGTKGIFSQGNKIHRIAQSWLKQHDDYFGSESILDGYFQGITARGKSDGRINGYIVEVKSINNLPENPLEIFNKYPQYIEQLAFYSIIDPLTPKENYLIFITREYPYNIRTYKLLIIDFEKIKNILKKRIYQLRQIFNERLDINVLGSCRYCNKNYCNIADRCNIWTLPKLECEIKEFVSLSDAPEFTLEITALKEKYGENFEFYQAFNILHPRKFCLEIISNKEDIFDKKHITEKAYFSNLVFEFMINNELFLESQEIKESLFSEFKLNKYNWFIDKNSLYPEGKITPFIVHVSDFENFDRPHEYKIAELGTYLMAHGLNRGMVFQYYPKKDRIKVFEISFDFKGDYVNEIKKIINGLKNPSTFKSLPKCSFGCSSCVYKEECLD